MATLRPHKFFIAIRLCTTQLKITMRNSNGITRLMKHVKHYHGIQPSTYSQKDFIGSFAELVAGNMIMKKL